METPETIEKILTENNLENLNSKPQKSGSLNKLMSLFRKRKLTKKLHNKKHKETELQMLDKNDFKENIPEADIYENVEKDGQKIVDNSDELCENFSGKITTFPLPQRGRGKAYPIETRGSKLLLANVESSKTRGRGRGLSNYRQTQIQPGSLPPLSDTETEDYNSAKNCKYFFIMKQSTSPVKHGSYRPTLDNLKTKENFRKTNFIQYVASSYTHSIET
ncbi:hypothetical protein HELRODRAFT_168924 [Helobdella robusta]|uniref:Uncharacterized protein n=1 Tax=Helobdella robusta TaxID=6412 RepID=T1F151_HELRO|nr:hypothetical protein HELRODRAFT_168924 [Helobdella robusta]ESO08994.1 hypothetical protein HELRODRAFT_168924 [Helobdella robusta]